jgi:hypothetical protein
VADRLALLDDLELRLVVVEAARIGALALGIRTGPALVEQELREVEIRLLAGDAIQLHERHLGDLMARARSFACRTERSTTRRSAALMATSSKVRLPVAR